MTYPACSHGRGIFKKTIFATRSFLAGHSSTLESLVNAFDSALPAHPPNLFPPDEKPSLPLEPLVSVSAPAHSPLPPDEKPSLDSQDVLVAASARSYGAGTFKNTIFATRCLLGHPLPLEPLVSVSAPAHSPLPPDEKPSLDSQDVLVGRLSTLLRGRHFQEHNLRYPLPARPPPSPGAAGQRLCPRPFPPSTRREALPRLPGRLGGRLSTLLRGRHFQEHNSSLPVACSATPFPWSRWSASLPPPIPPFHPTRSPPSTPRTSWWPPQHALTGPALSRTQSSLPVACSATPFPWSRWSASLPPPIPPFHPTRSPPSTPRTSWWPPQHALTGPALSRTQSSLPVACSATPFPWSR